MVGIPRPAQRIDAYSFELSGGLRQRVMIALALAAEPRILIADEPSTALDVTTQAQILELIRRLQQERGLAVILITHDMGVIAEMADHVVVMYLGHEVEKGPVDAIFHAPSHPYTRALLRSIPSVLAKPRSRLATIAGSIPHPFARPSGCPFHPRCPEFMRGTCDKAFPAEAAIGESHAAACHLYTTARQMFRSAAMTCRLRPSWKFAACARIPCAANPRRPVRLFNRNAGVVRAVDDISFAIARGETLSLVGESGCGKTTTARCILRAIAPTGGEIMFHAAGGTIDVAPLDRKALRPLRRQMQMIFQDPFSSLNPRMTIAEIIGEPLLVNGMTDTTARNARVAELLELVNLPSAYLNRFPHAFSGGQRQRIGIARALALNPALIVADEPVSALDVSVQAQIVNLLLELQERLGLSYLFVAHDLSVVKHVSHRVAVMYAGRIVEIAPDRGAVHHPAPSLHPGAAVRRAGARPAPARAPHHAGRRGGGSVQSAHRLPLPSALPLCDGALPADRAGPGRRRAGPRGTLSAGTGAVIGRGDGTACRYDHGLIRSQRAHMATATAMHQGEPIVGSGAVIAFRLFDVAYAIDLAKVEAVWAARARTASRGRLTATPPKAVAFDVPPVSLVLDPVTLTLDGIAVQAEVTARVYDFGAVSIALRVPIRDAPMVRLRRAGERGGPLRRADPGRSLDRSAATTADRDRPGAGPPRSVLGVAGGLPDRRGARLRPGDDAPSSCRNASTWCRCCPASGARCRTARGRTCCGSGFPTTPTISSCSPGIAPSSTSRAATPT